MNNHYFSLVILVLMAVASHATASSSQNNLRQNDSTQSSFVPRIPEPMLFDLVRPLGDAKGKLEINTLADHNLRSGEVNWAPEIEYSFLDGYAVELELPFNDLSLAQYKFAFQGTLGTLLDSRMIHGWQVIGRHDRHEKHYFTDVLYLNGMHLSGKWSLFYMLGVRSNLSVKRERLNGLFNNSVFYSFSRQLTLGLEINSELPRWQKWRYRVIPQIHYDFTRHTALQLGGGPARLGEHKQTEWMVTWRLVHAF
jgi:hypothetical protein